MSRRCMPPELSPKQQLSILVWTRVGMIIEKHKRCFLFVLLILRRGREGLQGKRPGVAPCRLDIVTVFAAGNVEGSTRCICRWQQENHERFHCVQVAFSDRTSSWWCCGVSIVGDLRNAVTGVVQDLLLDDTHTHTTLDDFNKHCPNTDFKIKRAWS